MMFAMETCEAMRIRMTEKILASPENPWPVPENLSVPVQTILEAGGSAPFHYPAHKSHRDVDGSIFPWHAYWLGPGSNRSLLQSLMARNVNGGKIFGLLAAAEVTILVTWKPTPDPLTRENPQLFSPTLENMEHIAAASASIQNMLLAATDRHIPNYWSSGGVLRNPDTFTALNIPHSQILLGALFFFPPKSQFPSPPIDNIPGKLRSQRPENDIWCSQIAL